MGIDSFQGARTKSPARRYAFAALVVALAAGAFAAGFHIGGRGAESRPIFHDMRVNHVPDLISLVDPGDPAVRALAERLAVPEAAYVYVRDRVRYEPRASAVPPGQIIRDGASSCLGKATLLCSLYRAMGIPADDARIVTGSVVLSDGFADHAWVDLEYKGACLQQDPSGFLGTFDFAQFPDLSFTRSFVHEEDYCFNDEGFAVVSRLNRFRKGFPGGMGAAR